jgi:threonyl-tRNA synthetase
LVLTYEIVNFPRCLKTIWATRRIGAFSQETLKEAILEMDKNYVINEGDGAFYGPKLDFHLEDSLSQTLQWLSVVRFSWICSCRNAFELE